jgi:hypothetical protein
LYLLLSLYFLAAFSFFIFFLPVVIKVMNTLTFLTGGLISLAVVGSIIYLFYRKEIFETKEKLKHHAGLILGLFLFFNLLYFLNWIPPVPLSMKYAGVYHKVNRNGDVYSLKQEKPEWYQFFKTDDSNFNYVEGDTVYCFAAVFAPTDLRKKILHHWQFYSEKEGEWFTSDRRGYELHGGREGGYRGYSFKRNVKPGEWRVDIITEDDLLLGRIDFEIIAGKEIKREWEILNK